LTNRIANIIFSDINILNNKKIETKKICPVCNLILIFFVLSMLIFVFIKSEFEIDIFSARHSI